MMRIERFGHGGDIWTAAEAFGKDPSEWLDYSANINPLGPPPRLFAALRDALPGIVRYPDPACRELTARLAESLGVTSGHVLAGNGAAELIQLALAALSPGRVGVCCPSFSEYEAAARKAGCEVVPLYTRRERHFLPDADDLLALAERADLIFIGHPNNPVGNHLPVGALREVARRCCERGTVLCVDEAFLDFLPDADDLSLLPDIDRLPTVLLLRSMTKMYAIPGLRLGYVVGRPELIRRLAERQVPWSVNHLAQAAGIALLEELPFVRETQAYVAREREHLSSTLQSLPGVTVFPGRANYLLVHVEGTSSYELQAALARRGVLIRNCSMYPGLGEGYVRLAVRTREENGRMLAAFRETLAELNGSRGGRR